MEDFQMALAIIALLAIVLSLGSTLWAIWFTLADKTFDRLIKLTELILSWRVVAAGLVFGGGEAILQSLVRLVSGG